MRKAGALGMHLSFSVGHLPEYDRGISARGLLCFGLQKFGCADRSGFLTEKASAVDAQKDWRRATRTRHRRWIESYRPWGIKKQPPLLSRDYPKRSVITDRFCCSRCRIEEPDTSLMELVRQVEISSTAADAGSESVLELLPLFPEVSVVARYRLNFKYRSRIRLTGPLQLIDSLVSPLRTASLIA